MSGAITLIPPKGRFDMFLAPDVGKTLRDRAERIRARHAAVTQDMIAIGKEIAQAKAEVEHGAFLAWLDDEVGIEPRTAQNYMRAAVWAETNTKLISHLQPTSVIQLAAPKVPPNVLEAIEKRVDAGEVVTTKNVKSLLQEARDKRAEEKRLAEEAKLTPRTKKRRAEEKAERERKLQDSLRVHADQLERERKDCARLAAILVQRLSALELADLRSTLVRRKGQYSLIWTTRYMNGLEASPMDLAIADVLLKQTAEDDLVNEGGVMDMRVREARLFKEGADQVPSTPDDFQPEPMFTKGALAS